MIPTIKVTEAAEQEMVVARTKTGATDVSHRSKTGATDVSPTTRKSTHSAFTGSGSSVASDLVHVLSSVDNRGRIRDYYSVENTPLGVGSFSTVFKARNRRTKQQVAIKSISKAKAKTLKAEKFKAVKSEITVLKMLDHMSIVKLVETFEDERTIRLVMELCDGGELSERLIDAGKFTEAQAATLMQQIFQAMSYMHSKQVCHRDMKPDNILFDSRESIEHSSLKIIDFGSARVFQSGHPMHTRAGSSYFMSPQVLLGRYGNSCDLWSCGVVLHIMLCGYPPFSGETEEDVLLKVRRGTFTFNAKDWKKVSKDAQMLIKSLIKKNPQERYTADQALNDGWIRNEATEVLDTVPKLKRWQSEKKMKRAAPQAIAEQLTEGQIRSLDEIFVHLDSRGEGMLNATQLRAGLHEVGLAEMPGEFDEIFEDFSLGCEDGGPCEGIDYKQFVAKTLEKKQVLQETACWNAFSQRSDDGRALRQEELMASLKSISVQDAFGKEAVAKALQKVLDVQGVQAANFDEFMALLSPREPLRLVTPRGVASSGAPGPVTPRTAAGGGA
jgi:calcium-dependent protein kinase